MEQEQSKFDVKDAELAKFTRALALPVRVTIIRILIEQEDWVENSRFESLPLVPEVTARHLKALRK